VTLDPTLPAPPRAEAGVARCALKRPRPLSLRARSVKRASVALAVALVSLPTIAELVRLRPYSIEDVRPINELRIVARWMLGRALAAVEREPEGGDRRTTIRKVSSGFWKWTKEKLGLHPETVTDDQRINKMPVDELEKAYDKARREARLLHYGELIVLAPVVVPREPSRRQDHAMSRRADY
jgi:hypothetical protein